MISLILFLAGSFGTSDLISWKTVKISLITSPTWCFLCCSRKEREKAQHLGHTQGEGQIHKTASRKPFGRDKHTRTHTQKQGQTESQNHKTVFRQARIQTHATNRQDSRKHGEGGVENSNLGPFFLRWHPGEMLWFLSLKWHRHTTAKPAWVYSGLPGLLCAGSLSRMFLSFPCPVAACCCYMPDLHSNVKGKIYFYFLAPFSSSAESYSLLVLVFFSFNP